ncbi:hypothetical protein G6011_07823 [Alternaria panax]|uniref:Uncharacterized protein n=1 Tax=Alternaria panax TaxID=48097 RepID=A0AAD4I785_9PLEO|nr:hypothetical protein G6011_07823 [Alternaria panax]
MSAESPHRPQQLGFLNKMLRRNDSAVALSSVSAASSTNASFASLTQENDKLAQDNARLQKRNEELSQQSELNQNLFHDAFEALAAKESEVAELEGVLTAQDNGIADLEGIQKELKDCIRHNDDASNETIRTLEAVAKREARWMQLKNHQQQLPIEDADKQQQRHHRELNNLSAAHCAQLREKNKTIHFLRCREGKAYKRIDRLMGKLAAAEKLSRDWEATITLANSKVKAIEVKPQVAMGE